MQSLGAVYGGATALTNGCLRGGFQLAFHLICIGKGPVPNGYVEDGDFWRSKRPDFYFDHREGELHDIETGALVANSGKLTGPKFDNLGSLKNYRSTL